MNDLTIPLEQYTKEVASLNQKIKSLEEQLAWFQRQVFGQKAEKFVGPKDLQLYFEGFDGLDLIDPKSKTTPIPAHERKERKRTGKDSFTYPPPGLKNTKGILNEDAP